MDYLAKIVQKMTGLALDDRANRLEGETRFFDPPLVGVADAADPLFAELKNERVVGALHRLPNEWLPGARAVVSYFLPFNAAIRRANYPAGTVSQIWLRARFEGEGFNNMVRRALISLLREQGGRAVAPLLEKSMVVDMEQFRSSWSERHVAYIAGLGTFSLSRGLITAKGMAGRFGSVVTDLALDPTPRQYREIYEFCPWMRDRSCGACIKRCPSGAITGGGKDKQLCVRFFDRHPDADPRGYELKEKHGYPHLACGKCQTNVPCEDRIP